MSNFLHDLRYAAPDSSPKSAGFNTGGDPHGGLGIGAKHGNLQCRKRGLLRPLPLPRPNRLVFLGEWSEQIPEMSISMRILTIGETRTNV